MSWTNENESNPQGDWGQGAVNDIGWGQAAQNLISWGMAHALSWGHAITNLVGSLFPSDVVWSDWLSEFVPASINSGTGLDFVAANGDTVMLSEVLTLTGDYSLGFISDSVSTQQRWHSDTLDSDFAVQNVGGFIRIKSGSATPSTFSTAIVTGVDYKIKKNASSGNFDLYADNILVDSTPLALNTDDFKFGQFGRSGLGAYSDGKLYMAYSINGNGVKNTFDFFQSAGSRTETREFATTGVFGTIMGATAITGSPYGEQLYNWGVNKYTTGGVLDNDNGTVYITGEFQDSITDIKGAAIALPYIENVDNAPYHPNHYSQLEAVANTIDTSGDFSVCAWLAVTAYGDGGQVLTNGSMQVTISPTIVTFTRDGVVVLPYAHNSLGFIFVGFTSNSSGTTDVWIGDVDNAPVKVLSAQAAGAATAATLPMYKNNNQALSNRLNGYNGIAAMQELITTDEDIQVIYNYTLGVIASEINTWNDSDLWNDSESWND